ncbi:TPA: hypothetical protein R2S23_005043 [Escherichia coli]|nr:hypothetical protein [Escherichia coli]HEC3253757.1 hypothetical protein [Escherichia coli]
METSLTGFRDSRGLEPLIPALFAHQIIIPLYGQAATGRVHSSWELGALPSRARLPARAILTRQAQTARNHAKESAPLAARRD